MAPAAHCSREFRLLQQTETLPTARYPIPATILDLANWSLQLPVKDAMIVKQPQLNFFNSSIFYGMVVLVTPAGGDTTSGSQYPRTELREMKNAGRDEASWGTSDGTRHVMNFSGAPNRLPRAEPGVTIAQVKSSRSEPMELRVLDEGKGPTVVVRFNDTAKDKTTLDSAYRLGSFYSITITVEKGSIAVAYANGAKAANTSRKASAAGCYSKVGNYLQSDNRDDIANKEWAEVVIRSLRVTHSK
ncbi:hypothetical protein GPECTOR_11g116 [Gonium pectorale]|uniref:Alginate lyase 2 domain-containing protein n=1 Tax=Gonium pectorale TaxID=33097 RepID=A0A150GPA1_GONPE|nr:hypothetical protein GPECTOR_11g116 [Gonium pectorale]|eukprot:KXZ51663.1 hypothetical protein GPECTOR_11g116 [Gonium pectorale]